MSFENNIQVFNTIEELTIPVKKPWVFSGLEKLSITQPSHQPGIGADGDAFPDCTRS